MFKIYKKEFHYDKDGQYARDDHYSIDLADRECVIRFLQNIKPPMSEAVWKPFTYGANVGDIFSWHSDWFVERIGNNWAEG